jgi:8-oxo-dGTP diphosphatase
MRGHPGETDGTERSIDDEVLWALDLIAQRFPWEAHEVLEGVWRRVTPGSPARELTQGLVKLCAACLKRHTGDGPTALRLEGEARARLGAAGAGGVSVLGVDVADALAAVDVVASGGWPVLVPRRVIRVVAAAIVVAGRVLAARRRPELARGGLWELPGGKVEAGEGDHAALAREVREELGLDVVPGEALGEALHDYGDVAIRLVAYVCASRGGDPVLSDHDELAWLGPDELERVAWAPADVPLLDAVRRRLGG